MKTCTSCEEEKPESEFHKDSSAPDGLTYSCKDCRIEQSMKHYSKEKQNEDYHRNMNFIIEVKKNGCCVDCGKNNWKVLEFDHVIEPKKFNVSKPAGRPLETIKKEIEKCELRCANCHRKRTLNKKQYDLSGKENLTSREKRKKIIYDYKINNNCYNCDEGNPKVLNFKHVKGKKKFKVTNGVYSKGKKKIRNEIKKCVLICANCQSLEQLTG